MKNYYHNSIPVEEKTSGRIVTGYPISQAVKTIGISSLLIFGFVLALGSSIPATSPETGSPFYYQHYMSYKKGTDSAYGANYDHGRNDNPTSPYGPPPAPSVALKDCSQIPSPQQT